MTRTFLLLAVLFLSFPSFARAEEATSPAEPEKPVYTVAVLQGLNKVTTRISRLEAPVGTSIRFGTLEIIVKRCWKSPPDQRPENAILMEIWDHRPGETAPKAVFHGWMFSSSPSLSGLEHPVYDVIALNCVQRELGGDT